MRASARIVAESDERGRTRLTVVRGEAPLLPRRTGPDVNGGVTVHLVGGCAGPLGGDDLRVEIEVGPRATLTVRTVAATIALPGRAGTGSRLTVAAAVAAGGRLDWLPEPAVAVRGCDHTTHSTVELAEDARLCWREELVCGREHEECGDLRLSTAVRLAGRPLLSQDLTVGPRATGWDGPAVLAGARTTGSVLLVDPAWRSAAPPARTASAQRDWRAARMPLAGPAVLAIAVATDAHALRTALERMLPEQN